MWQPCIEIWRSSETKFYINCCFITNLFFCACKNFSLGEVRALNPECRICNYNSPKILTTRQNPEHQMTAALNYNYWTNINIFNLHCIAFLPTQYGFLIYPYSIDRILPFLITWYSFRYSFCIDIGLIRVVILHQ